MTWWKLSPWYSKAGIVLIAVVLVAPLLPSSSTELQIDAYLTCQTLVRDRLLAPATARFPDYAADFVRQSDSTFTVTAFVDVHNRFGALVRSEWSCLLIKRREQWIVRTVQL